jgi:TonB-linked SusC/RagA family outer membrane protein
MKKILSIICFLWVSLAAFSQGKIEVTGTVTDEKDEPMIGVTVSVKDSPGMGAVTGLDGRYKISVNQYSYLIFTYLGYDKQEIFIKDKKVVNVAMKPSKANILNEVTVTGLGTRKKITVTGAVTTVDVDKLKTPTSSIANALAGNVPGIFAQMSSGQPGNNVSEFWIRGISTFGGGTNPLVLVDGFERDLNDINIEDVQSITVLKDASATAIYGSRGANGVILVTTKHGKEGKVNINGKVETSYSARTMTPKLVDGLTYANLENEALTSRNQEAAYTASDLNLIKTGLDPDLFPNVNWLKLLLKKGAPTYRADLNVSGGGSLARYFLSGSYIDEGGIYKVDDAMKKTYNTNANYRRWNYRMNTDVNITKTTLLSLGISGSLDSQNEPGGLSTEIWESLLGQNPISIPVKYSNGYVASRGYAGKNNPWVLVTQQGYTETWKNRIQLTLNLDQDLGFITKGLKFFGRFGYDTNDQNYNRHMQWPDGYQAQTQRDDDGNIAQVSEVKRIDLFNK